MWGYAVFSLLVLICSCFFFVCENMGSMCVCPTTHGQRASCGWCWRSGRWSFLRSSSLSMEEFRTLICTHVSSRWWARASSKLQSPPGPGFSLEGSTQVCSLRLVKPFYGSARTPATCVVLVNCVINSGSRVFLAGKVMRFLQFNYKNVQESVVYLLKMYYLVSCI